MEMKIAGAKKAKRAAGDEETLAGPAADRKLEIEDCLGCGALPATDSCSSRRGVNCTR